MKRSSLLSLTLILAALITLSIPAWSGTIRAAKLMPDGSSVSMDDAVVTAVLDDCFYVESHDRSSGIKVLKEDHDTDLGVCCEITGTVLTNEDGERYIDASVVTLGDYEGTKPIGMPLKCLGGGDMAYDGLTGSGQRGVTGASGVNNIGLYVRVWGQVTGVGLGEPSFRITDGSDVGSDPIFGTKAICEDWNQPEPGSFVEVTGISSCYREFDGSISRLIKVDRWSPLSAPPAAVAMAGVSPEIATTWDDGGILLAWNTPASLCIDDIVEYHIWMDGYDSTHFPVRAVSRDLAVPLSGAAGRFSHSAVVGTSFGQFEYYRADENHELQSVLSDLPEGVIPGRTHRFWVSALYRRMNPSTGDYTWWETTPATAGCATYLYRPSCVAPDMTMDMSLGNVTFEWTGTRGATLYRIEVSTSPLFERTNTWCTDIPAWTTDGSAITRTFTDVLNNALELSAVQPGTTLYWRVGARNNADTPGPYPAGTGPSAAASGPKNTRFIYCDQPYQFMVGTPPDDDGGGGEEPPPPPL